MQFINSIANTLDIFIDVSVQFEMGI